jgi:tRNA dimethylallyltransferase
VVIAVFGPTGVGKTAVATRLASSLGVRVISCDSMQIYRGFPVLTNQPSGDVTAAGVRHELVAVADPEEEWSAGHYARLAQPLIDEDVAATGWAVIAGGTGLYLRASLAPLDMAQERDLAVRSELERLAESDGPHRLHDRLVAFDPEAAAAIHPHNVRRVIRALEVVTTRGRGAWSGRADLWTPRYRHRTLLVGLSAERPLLYERVDARARAMIEGGAVDEVRRYVQGTRQSNVGWTGTGRGVERAIGFREIAAYLAGGESLEDTTAALASATRRYVRRQLTWMRKLSDAVIIDVSGLDVDAIEGRILQEARAVAQSAAPMREEHGGRPSGPDVGSDIPG